jgi:uncharacterized repeat protein (TIGR03803 family)
VLHTFTNGADGGDPDGLIQGSDGNFYGTATTGGAGYEGTIFKITPAGVETVLYAFTGGADGSGPNALIQGSDGYLYGTTSICESWPGIDITLSGTVFKF